MPTSFSDILDFIADSVGAFLTENELTPKGPPLKLGFVFGFALKKSGINKGEILGWSKGFSVQDAVGKNASELLQDALNRKQVPVKCEAVINDVSVGFCRRIAR